MQRSFYQNRLTNQALESSSQGDISTRLRSSWKQFSLLPNDNERSIMLTVDCPPHLDFGFAAATLPMHFATCSTQLTIPSTTSTFVKFMQNDQQSGWVLSFRWVKPNSITKVSLTSRKPHTLESAEIYQRLTFLPLLLRWKRKQIIAKIHSILLIYVSQFMRWTLKLLFNDGIKDIRTWHFSKTRKNVIKEWRFLRTLPSPIFTTWSATKLLEDSSDEIKIGSRGKISLSKMKVKLRLKMKQGRPILYTL